MIIGQAYPFIPCPSKNTYLIIAFHNRAKRRTILDSLTRPTKRGRGMDRLSSRAIENEKRDVKEKEKEAEEEKY